MSSNCTLYYTAVEDMLQDELELGDAACGNQSQSEIEPYTHTPKRTVRIRQHNLFSQDSAEFVIRRRSPIPLAKHVSTCISDKELSPQTRKDFQGIELLRLRKKKSENEQKQNLQRRLTIRI